MFSSVTASAWMASYLEVLPCSNNPLFTEVWKHNRFSFLDQTTWTDEIDLRSAQLVCAALHDKQQLLVVLPNRSPHRPALLLANCLVMDALDAIRYPNITPHKVVYFGTTLGIREQIASVKIHDLALDLVFPAYRISRTTTEAVTVKPKLKVRRQNKPISIANALPQVICVYAPADPRRVIDQLEPTWIAVDCSDNSSVRWLPSLLTHAKHLNLPVVAWCQSSLATTAWDFAQAGGLTFRWPKTKFSMRTVSTVTEQAESNQQYTNVTPLIVDVEHAPVSSTLQQAYIALVAAGRYVGDQRLLRDALNVGWRYLQALELLPVPLTLYETEVQRFWGASPLATLQQMMARFISAVSTTCSQAAVALQTAYEALSLIHSTFMTMEPPLWTMLVELCLSQDKPSLPRVLVFSTEYRKRLFNFALLSRHNITEHELQAKGIWLTSLKSWYQEHTRAEREQLQSNTITPFQTDSLPLNTPYQPTIIGLPGTRQAVNIEPLLSQATGQVVIYPYQHSALVRRIQEWDALVMPSMNEQAQCLTQLTGNSIERTTYSTSQPRIQVSQPTTLHANVQRVSKLNSTTLWTPLSPAQELASLFEPDEEPEAAEVLSEMYDTMTATATYDKETWTTTAITLRLEADWRATFAADDLVQVVVGSKGVHVEERYVRSVRPHDRILFIIGQRRQNLYDLIITRVHAHPAIELHLAMIRRWQEDLLKAYSIWKRRHQASLDELLSALKTRGSRLTSAQTLRLWLSGKVLCPEDVDDLRRVARILDMPFVYDNYRHIAKAAQRLRNIHRALARRLNRWIQQEVTGALSVGELDTSVLDKELGLTFSDFRDSLLILEVEAVQQQQGLFLLSSLGQLERKDR